MLNSSSLSMITNGFSWGCLILQLSLFEKTILGLSFFGIFIGGSCKWTLFISLPCAFCKVVFFKYVFSLAFILSNLIVILFNLMYLVFVVEIYCKGCVIVRESVKTQAIEVRRVFVGISRLNIPRKDACTLHIIGMRRVSTDGNSCVSWVSRG